MNNQHHLVTPYANSLRRYNIGFILSLVLTLIPFIVLINGLVSGTEALILVIVCAIMQIIAQLICFFHLSYHKEESWNLIALIFTLMVIFIVVGGSLWIMHDLNSNMML